MFINFSSVIIFMVSPFYLTKVLGVTQTGLGLIEGGVEFIAWSTRIVSGVISDYMGRRKPILTFAYSLTLLSRPLFLLIPNFFGFFTAKSLDRFGNGIQATAREALVADHAPSHLKGAAFGLRQSLSVIGSVLGGITLWFYPITHDHYDLLFMIAASSPVVAIVILVVFVKDSRAQVISTSVEHRKFFSTSYFRKLSPDFWRIIIVSAIFSLSNYSGVFLMLHAQDIVQTDYVVPLVMILQNLFAMVSAYPIGRLSDRFDRRILLGVGFCMVIFSGIVLGSATNLSFVLAGACLWGMHIGITQSLLMAKVADTTSPEIRGTGFGIYYILTGSMLFLTNYITGTLSDLLGKHYIFYVSAGLAFVALCALPVMKSHKKREI
ncbi:MAG: MFS transporter [Alphaproteobacteria bacterium]|nr:MFS transporter [Alphaproteobacteria bacterium]